MVTSSSYAQKGTGLLTQKPRDPTYTTLLGSHTGPTRTLLHAELPHNMRRPGTRLPEHAQEILLHGPAPQESILRCNVCYQKHPKQQYSRGLLSIVTSKHHVQKKGKASLSLRTGNNQTPETKTKNQHVPSVLAPHTSTTARRRRHEHCPITAPIRSLLVPPAAALRHYSFTDVTTHLWRSAS